METVVCPNCSEPASSEDFTCPRCEVILNAAALECEPISLVEALLSPTNAAAARSGEVDAQRGNALTVRATVVMDEFTVPRLLVGVDLALKPLHPFEAYVASFVDGRHSVPEIAASADISRLEAMAVLQTLAFRDVVELNRDEGRVPGGGQAPELDAEPKTDGEGLPPEQVEAARREAASEARPPPRLSPSSPPSGTRAAPAASAALPQAQAGSPAGSANLGAEARPSLPRASAVLLQDRPTPYQREQSVEYTLERAISMERRGDLEGAIYILKKAIAQSRNAAPLYNKLALALVRRKDFAEAVRLLEKAVGLAPQEGTYQQNLYKVMGLAAASDKSPRGGKGGVLSKLLGRK